MHETLVLTVLGPDRPGIVDSLATVVREQDGSWEKSHLARLAGHFAGIVEITCPQGNRSELQAQLRALAVGDLKISVEEELVEPPTADRRYELDVIGNDRPGIVAEISKALHSQNANILQIETEVLAAPESGQPIFQTLAIIALPENQESSQLAQALESLSPDLQVALNG